MPFPSNYLVKDVKNEIHHNHTAFHSLRNNHNSNQQSFQSIISNMELFMADDERDPSKGIWLDENKPLDHYLLRSGANLFYQDVRRILVVKMLDQSKKSVEVNDAQTVSQM